MGLKMRDSLQRLGRPMLIGAVLAFLPTLACDNNPASNGNPACDHVDADGLVVEQGGQVAAAQWQGDVTGGFAADAGALGPTVEATFLDQDSTRVTIGPECPDHGLVVEVADPAIAAIELSATSRWQFQVRGLSEGSTTLRIRLWHGDHSDFTSLPFPITVGPGAKQEPVGLVVRQDTQVLASVWQGVVTGELALGLELTNLLDVTFVDEDSVEFLPPTPVHSLAAVIADSSIAGFRAEGDWGFRLLGKALGTTTLTLVLNHEDHADFTSPPIPVHVEQEVEATALVIRQNGSMIASWNLDPVQGPGASIGEIIVDEGASLVGAAVSFLDPDGAEFVPQGGETLGIEVANQAIALLAPVGDPWSFTVQGLAAGSTTAVFTIQHEGHIDFTSGAIPVQVTTSTPGPGTSFLLRKNGIAQLIVVDGVLVPSCGSTTANPGHFETPAGTLTELYSFRLLAPDCTSTTIASPPYSLAFEFADPGIARIVNHPEHWGEITIFHIEGLVAGETTLRLRLLNAGQVTMTSPPIPVVISVPRSGVRDDAPGSTAGRPTSAPRRP